MKKKAYKGILAIIMGICLISGLIPVSKNSNLVEAAAYSNGGCVSWVKARASQIGVTLPPTGYNKYGVAGASAYWEKLPSYGYSVGTEPAPNALAVWEFSSVSAYQTYGHVAYVESVNGDNVTLTEGGVSSSYSYNGNTGVRSVTVSKNSVSSLGGCSGFYGYIYLADTPVPSGYSPEGGVESLAGGKGLIWMNGWTFDRDAWTSAVTIEVFIGGNSVGSYTADLERTDIGTAYPGVGNYHGFNLTIPTSKTGTQRVEIWARSIGGGGDILLGANNVNIEPADSNAPVFKSVKVAEVDAYGYFVECEVADDSVVDRVMCPTWTENNGQDDLIANWQNNESVKATLNDGVYTFRVNVLEHNSEYGTYNTHLYAYDTSGNFSVHKLLVTVTNEKMPKRVVRYEDSVYSVYEDGLSWNGAVSYAKSMNSNLVSISTDSENDVVYKLINGLYKYGYYIGGYSNLKSDNYKWTDGNPFIYSNWAVGEPSYTSDEEFYACMVNGGNGLWNDVGTALIDGTSSGMGFVIETPLDLEENMVLETDTKIYKYYNIPMPYTLAQKFCEEKGGYLACITSEEENELIISKLYEENRYYYIGANDTEVEGEFRWINGEVFEYANWNPGDPNSISGNDCNEEYVGIDCNGKWRDMTGQGSLVGFIAEFDKEITSPESSAVPSIEPSKQPSEMPSLNPSIQPSRIPSSSPDVTTSAKPNEPIMKGDVNNDNQVTLADAQIVLKAALKITSLTDSELKVAEVNNDGTITLADAQLILKVALRISAF